MEKMRTGATIAVAALSTLAIAAAYNSMKPNTKQQLKHDMRNTLDSMEGVKNELGNVGEDMSDMARNLKKNMM